MQLSAAPFLTIYQHIDKKLPLRKRSRRHPYPQNIGQPVQLCLHGRDQQVPASVKTLTGLVAWSKGPTQQPSLACCGASPHFLGLV
jgi:hypothetical protein